jgi:hypothetical protein
MAFAKKNTYGAGGNFHKNFKPLTPKGNESSTSLAMRLLPAKGSLEKAGKWKLYMGTHFGFKGSPGGNDTTKLRMRTFKCVEDKDFRSGIIRTGCAECDQIAEKKKKKATIEAQMTAAGKSKDEIAVALAPVNDWLKEHNVDRKWHINAMAENGDFGVLQISHKCMKQLDARIDELVKKGIDPLDPEQGVWFVFKRSGKGIEVNDTVEILTEEVEVVIDGEKQKLQRIKKAPLSDEQLEKADEVCPDLPTVVRALTPEQVKDLVACNGEPEAVDAIFDAGQERSAPPVRTETKGLAKKPENKPAEKPAEKKAEKPAEKAPEPPAEDDEEAQLAKQLAALKAKKAAAAAAKAKADADAAAATEGAGEPNGDITDEADLSDDAYSEMFKA